MSNPGSFDQANPYSPSSTPAMASPANGNLNPADLKKTEAIIKDAGQFWLAILLCFLCSGLGAGLLLVILLGLLVLVSIGGAAQVR